MELCWVVTPCPRTRVYMYTLSTLMHASDVQAASILQLLHSHALEIFPIVEGLQQVPQKQSPKQLWKAGKQGALQAAEKEQQQANLRTRSSPKSGELPRALLWTKQRACINSAACAYVCSLECYHSQRPWQYACYQNGGSSMTCADSATQVSTIASHALDYVASKSSWES